MNDIDTVSFVIFEHLLNKFYDFPGTWNNSIAYTRRETEKNKYCSPEGITQKLSIFCAVVRRGGSALKQAIVLEWSCAPRAATALH